MSGKGNQQRSSRRGVGAGAAAAGAAAATFLALTSVSLSDESGNDNVVSTGCGIQALEADAEGAVLCEGRERGASGKESDDLPRD